jgi:competence protein ComEC
VSTTFIVLDVAQGNCAIAIDDLTRLCIVVDCPAGGAALTAERIVQLEAEPDTVIVSHSHLDHLGGVIELCDLVRVRAIHYNHDRAKSANPDLNKKLTALLRALAALEDEGVVLGDARDDDGGVVGSLNWTVVAPSKGELTAAYAASKPNAGCAIVHLESNGVRVLLTGDSDHELWNGLLASGRDISSDILLIPHHGGEIDPTDSGVLVGAIADAVGASYHIISVGSNNSYDHPRRDVLEELASRRHKARLLCTQLNRLCLGATSEEDVRAEAKRSLPTTSDGMGTRGHGCPCAGTIVLRFAEGAITAAPLREEHGAVLALLSAPMGG